MNRRILKTLVCAVAILCMMCSSATVFAVEETIGSGINIQPITQPETTAEPTTEEPKETEAPETTAEPTTAENTRPYTPPVQNNNSGGSQGNGGSGSSNNNTPQNDTPVQNTPQTTKEETTKETTEETLPEGSFYVYLERNNGKRRLKTIMDGPGLVPEVKDPVREGYVFDGWYKDADFVEPWNFFTDVAKGELVIYAKWSVDTGLKKYPITIKQTEGGEISVNPVKASKGEPVVIIIKPEEGKRLAAGSMMINGEPTDVLSFVMPAKKVTITAKFEDIPDDVTQVVEKKSVAPFVISILVFAVLLVIVVVIVYKRRNDSLIEIDPDGPLDVEDDDDEGWIDDSITVEDGFVDGKIINTDRGFLSDEDEEEEEE